MDDESDKREYGSEMEYVMKGDFLRPRDSNVHQVGGYHLSVLPTPYRLDYPVGTVSLVSPASSKPILSLPPPSPSFSLASLFGLSTRLYSVPRVPPCLATLEPLLDPARHALYVRYVPLLSLFCMPGERGT